MNFIEGSFCSRQEYEAGEESRVMESEFVADELYVVMSALTSTVEDQRAAKFPARVGEVRYIESGRRFVSIEMLDVDLQPTARTWAMFENGYWLEVADNLVINKIPVHASYLKPYLSVSSSAAPAA